MEDQDDDDFGSYNSESDEIEDENDEEIDKSDESMKMDDNSEDNDLESLDEDDDDDDNDDEDDDNEMPLGNIIKNRRQSQNLFFDNDNMKGTFQKKDTGFFSIDKSFSDSEDETRKIEFYNEYVMKPVPTFWGWINYIIYFPVNLCLVMVFKDFHVADNQSPNKLAYYTIMSLLILTLLSYFLAYWSAVIAESVQGISIQTMAFTLGAWGLQMHYVYYNRKIAKMQRQKMKQFAFIIYFRQVGLLKIGFGIGLMWFLLTIFTDVTISMKDSPYRYQIYFYFFLTLSHTILITMCRCQVKNKQFIWILLLMYLVFLFFWLVVDQLNN